MRFFRIKTEPEILPWKDQPADMTVGNIPLNQVQINTIKSVSALDLASSTIPLVDDLKNIKSGEKVLAFNDNLFFSKDILEEFILISELQAASGITTQLALDAKDPFFNAQISKLITYFQKDIEYDVGRKLWLFPLYYSFGDISEPIPIICKTASTFRNLDGIFKNEEYEESKKYYIISFTTRVAISIEHWLHYSLSNLYHNLNRIAQGQFEPRSEENYRCELPNTIDENAKIWPGATISGSIIGKHAEIFPGAIITNCIIGDNVTVKSGAVLDFSMIGNNCYLDYFSTITGTTIMDNCVLDVRTGFTILSAIGKNTVIGAPVGVISDSDDKEARTLANDKTLQSLGMPNVGVAIGHDVRFGSGNYIRPGCMVANGSIIKFLYPVTKNVGDELQPIKTT